jgi:hypothetical protein
MVNEKFPSLLGDTHSSSDSDINELLHSYNSSQYSNPGVSIRRVPFINKDTNPFKMLSQL